MARMLPSPADTLTMTMEHCGGPGKRPEIAWVLGVSRSEGACGQGPGRSGRVPVHRGRPGGEGPGRGPGPVLVFVCVLGCQDDQKRRQSAVSGRPARTFRTSGRTACGARGIRPRLGTATRRRRTLLWNAYLDHRNVPSWWLLAGGMPATGARWPSAAAPSPRATVPPPGPARLAWRVCRRLPNSVARVPLATSDGARHASGASGKPRVPHARHGRRRGYSWARGWDDHGLLGPY